MLKIIFEVREEDLAILDEEDEIFMDEDETNRTKKYYYLKNKIENISDSSNGTKCEIIKIIEEYVEVIDFENVYFKEKYYLNGLKDGFKLLNEIKR